MTFFFILKYFQLNICPNVSRSLVWNVNKTKFYETFQTLIFTWRYDYWLLILASWNVSIYKHWLEGWIYWTRIVWLGGNWGVTGDWFVIYMNKLHSMDFNDFFSGVFWYLPCQDISQCRPSRNQLCYRSVTTSCWREGAKFNFRIIKIWKLELLFQQKIR